MKQQQRNVKAIPPKTKPQHKNIAFSTFKKTLGLIKRMGITGIFRIKGEDCEIEIDNRPPATVLFPSAPVAPEGKPSTTLSSQTEISDKKNTTAEKDNTYTARSPLVGTFFAASNPNAPPFVQVGDIVKSGQVLCIIEAMKLMNEVEAEKGGEVVKILVKDGQPVEYGQPLILIQC